MTTKELNERIYLMQEDTYATDVWVAACGLASILIMILALWDVFP